MKILIVAVTYYPNINGASYFTQRLANYLHQRGHSILVVAPSRTMANENYDLQGIKVFGIRSFPTGKNHFRIAQSVFIKKAIKKKIVEFSPDVIHLQSHFIFSKAVVEIAAELKIPLIGTNHFMPENLTHYLPLPIKAKKYVTRRMWQDFLKIFEKVDIVTSPTATGAKLLTDIGLTRTIIPVSNGVDLKIYNPQNSGEYLKVKYDLPKKPTLLYLGRLDLEKRIEVLLEAFALARKKIDAHFVVAGSGVEEDNLKAKAAWLNIEKAVTFTGFVAEADMPNLYRAADCFAIAGIAELQSLVTMEAMASGLPVIAVNAMALPHLVKPGENGFLFEINDIDSLAGHMAMILSDDGLRKRMSQASLEIIKKHDIEKIIDKYESLYNEVINC